MALSLRNKRTTPLVEHLADKAQELRINEEVAASQAKTYLEIAGEQKQVSKLASIQASAVERAHAILTDAGVQL